ncbi:MAG: hypothetical protein KDB48_10100, partial [Solirubrobacterales bacterium]|nr:hypothetical protein [Solirubrobacterales bacterium]
MKPKVLTAAISAALLAAIVMAGAAGPATSAEPSPKCAGGVDVTTQTVGIVQMKGCWTKRTTDGTDYFVAELASQPLYGTGERQIRALDMNGLLVSGVKDQDRIVVNTKTNAIRSVTGADETAAEIRLSSIGYPLPANPLQLGVPFKINFVPPNQGSMVLEDLQLGSNSAYVKSMAGFSPVGSVETPLILNEDGKGSMDLTASLTGIFTLKGKPQSVTIKIPSRVGEGSKV